MNKIFIHFSAEHIDYKNINNYRKWDAVESVIPD